MNHAVEQVFFDSALTSSIKHGIPLNLTWSWSAKTKTEFKSSW